MYLHKIEEQVYRKITRDIAAGRILTPDGLRIICEANDFDPMRIGLHFLEMNHRFQHQKEAAYERT